ncbi:Antiviral Innate Immune Response Receptor Rig-I [Manis pentadactyla]|nr:Antiviral Innate Immune Response Receptor Rig-I [Manis pentadactyla]
MRARCSTVGFAGCDLGDHDICSKLLVYTLTKTLKRQTVPPLQTMTFPLMDERSPNSVKHDRNETGNPFLWMKSVIPPIPQWKTGFKCDHV